MLEETVELSCPAKINSIQAINPFQIKLITMKGMKDSHSAWAGMLRINKLGGVCKVVRSILTRSISILRVPMINRMHSSCKHMEVQAGLLYLGNLKLG